MLIPVPDNWNFVEDLIKAGKKFITAMESMSVADDIIRNIGFDNLTKLS